MTGICAFSFQTQKFEVWNPERKLNLMKTEWIVKFEWIQPQAKKAFVEPWTGGDLRAEWMECRNRQLKQLIKLN